VCGIVGIASMDGKPVVSEELRSMSNAIAHRGPDDDGFYLTPHVGLGMRRLSIIDLSTGRQPICNEDGMVWVVFNGEIYNYKELRRGLEQRGHLFSTTTDTEVIVHLYEEEGAECVQPLRGMFSFAVWDDRRRVLLLARDRLGIKPLYYGLIHGRLVFASELKAILQLPEVRREFNWEAVNHLFTFLSTPPTESILQDIRKLEAGHTLLMDAGSNLQLRRYWDFRFEPNYGPTEDHFSERLRELFEESVSLHMVSDVPVGAFLSGGIDSAAVVARMARLSSAPVKTFSIGFVESDYNELEFARLVAKKFSTEHFELVLEPDVLNVVEDLTWHLDEPFGDCSAIPTYMVSKLAAQHVKVVLSGDGGDELFAGYDRYLIEEKERRYCHLPYPIRRSMRWVAASLPEQLRGRNFLYHFSLSGPERYLDGVTLFRRHDKENLFQDDALELLCASDPYSERMDSLKRAGGNWLSDLQWLDFRNYLPLDILTKVDRMSMAHSLEVRPPMLDHKLIEFVATIPPHLLLNKGRTKHIFKSAMKEDLPQQIVNRPKQGFAIPLGRWFRGQMPGYVRELLLSDRARQRGIFRPSYIEHLLKLHQRGRDLDLQLWTLISFELWCRLFLDRQPGYATEQIRKDTAVASLPAA
jgi:asparagine synthase (glutamine-hydrolysing)